MKTIASKSRQTYGSRRMVIDLTNMGHQVGRHRVRRLMRENGIEVKRRRRYRITTDSNHRLPVFPNLVKRKFEIDQPNRVWVSDITYIWTDEGWLYLAVVLDLFSRKVVGWALQRRMTSHLVCDALRLAIQNRRPCFHQLVHHSDRGVQYASVNFRHLLRIHRIEGSMSRKGDCWDNAVAESFFARLKTDVVHHENYRTRQGARLAVVDYIKMFYNSYRRHSSLGYLSPNEFESRHQLAKVA